MLYFKIKALSENDSDLFVIYLYYSSRSIIFGLPCYQQRFIFDYFSMIYTLSLNKLKLGKFSINFEELFNVKLVSDMFFKTVPPKMIPEKLTRNILGFSIIFLCVSNFF